MTITCDEVGQLLQFRDTAWWRLQLHRDILSCHIAQDEYTGIISKACDYGKKMAAVWNEFSPCGSVEQWLRLSGVEIRLINRIQAPPLVLFAAIMTNPLRIELYLDSIARAFDALSAGAGYAELAGIDKEAVKKIILAHECFHFLEDKCQKDYESYVVSYALGPLKRNSQIRQFSEVAAAVFAKDVCKIKFNPGILDAALLSTFDSKKRGSERTAEKYIKALKAVES